ncbi:RNA polymerase sigma factor [Indioceanicola profundi]|uniref:RNA polymerase sigma factor n=1 Tax=Indioceanicola profundi TaxID=2220096 RepID=UPI000E6A953B|nr:RNA polymerase sigma factor [Indioceanicola profundi]
MDAIAKLLTDREGLYRFIRRRVRDPILSEDILQETLARLLGYLRGGTVQNVPALGYRIADNLVRDHYRAHAAAPTEELSDVVPCQNPTADQVLIDRRRMEAFSRALEDMPPLRREVFVRRRLHGESYREIAAALDMSEAAVEKHVVRALEWLHLRVGPQDVGPDKEGR